MASLLLPNDFTAAVRPLVMKLAAEPLPSVTLPDTLKLTVPPALTWPTTTSPEFWKATLPLVARTSSRLMAPMLL